MAADLFRWQPGRDTLVALGTLALMLPLYYVGAHARGALGLLVFLLGANLLLNVAFPAWYVLRARRERASELGLTRRRALPALALGAAFAAFSWPALAQESAARGVAIAPHVLANLLMLWEPFFVHGWLQLRYERAFGVVPGILLAGFSFGVYHLGTFPLEGVLGLAGFGCVYALLFRATRNLLALWPLAWGVGGAIGTLQGGFVFGWTDVATAGGILLMQAAILRSLVRAPRDGLAADEPVPAA